MNRRAFLAGAGTVTFSGLAGCAGLFNAGPNPESDDYDVGMGSSVFRPRELEVGVGDTVVWKNTGSRRHTVTAYDGGLPDGAEYFASGGFGSQRQAEDGWHSGYGGAINAGQTYEHTFDVAGEYAYFCIPHEPQGMSGTVVVTE